MYHFVKAVCLTRTIGSQWHEVDLSQILVYDIFTTYMQTYLVLTNDFFEGEVYVDLNTLKPLYSSYAGTLEELLVELDNTTLETISSLPSTAVKYVKYSDAIRSEYKINTTKIGMNYPDNYPEEEKPDLVVTRPRYLTDLSLLHSHCLLSVNGYLHYTDTADNKAYIVDGAKTMRKSSINHVGILSFYDVGELNKVKIDSTRLIPQDPDAQLRDKLTFTVDVPLDNKTYLLVLGGHIVLADENVFWRSGEQSFTVDLNQLPYIERIFESKHYINLDSLGIDLETVNVDEIWSDVVIKRYFDLSQTYLVVVDSPYLLSNKIHIRHSQLPGMFTSYQDPVYPLILNYGKIAEYWKTHEDGFWSVTVNDSHYRNFIISAQVSQDLITMNDHLQPNKPFYFSRGYLLELAGYRN